MKVEIVQVKTPEEVVSLAELAKNIWNQHFTPIIGQAQVDYMLKNFQSAEAIQQQLNDGGEYYLAYVDGERSGYTCLIADQQSSKMMLSKLYVQSSRRGSGIGKALLDYAEQRAQMLGMSALWLTVNRFNDGPVAWYKRQGFAIVDELKKDIGNGFFMDDFIMQKEIASP
ncbi:GNAT family N-acetyltransferase [Thiomicrorhabdus sp.]|uniref:GNAT family N-acetyltransferase n=1 Tax=Thiomicrorhabdus sp. TaxID=2039724 RepID=UPI0029C8DA24|nr:GNAT family N-acetyltransferase [Thiomicrorhabdus sp.]